MSIWIDAWDREAGAERAAALYTERYGEAPAGVWSAPGRVNLIGEHTDYNGGLCLPLALPHRTYAAIGPAADGALRLVSARESVPWQGNLADVAPGTVEGWAGYVAGVAWALAQSGRPVTGFSAAVESCVPYGAGLSSSAALESGFAVFLAEQGVAAGTWVDPQPDTDAGRAELAAACVRAENEIAGANTGGMDQAASLRCRPGSALLLDTRDGSTAHVPFAPEEHGYTLLVMDTKAPHALVDGQYAQRRATCEAAAATLGVETLREIDPADLDGALARLGDDVSRARVRHVVTEIDRVTRFTAALEAGDLAEVGRLMDASHASLREDYEVSCAELDTAVEAARAAGALGARMTGGGFGGSAIALVPLAGVEVVADAVTAAFATAGYADAPEFLRAPASAAADRDR